MLVGRDDTKLAGSDPAVAALVESGAIRILTDVADAALDALYRAAAFTVLPSTQEGYGLPVADSLAYGKLCIAADLPVMRELFGDLPWYFDSDDERSLIAQLRRALDGKAAVAATEICAAARQPVAWAETAKAMRAAIVGTQRQPSVNPVALFASPRPPADFAVERFARAELLHGSSADGLDHHRQPERHSDAPPVSGRSAPIPPA